MKDSAVALTQPEYYLELYLHIHQMFVCIVKSSLLQSNTNRDYGTALKASSLHIA